MISKTVVRVTVPWLRIPPSPPIFGLFISPVGLGQVSVFRRTVHLRSEPPAIATKPSPKAFSTNLL
jgi:hypothetical protein